MKNRLQFSLRTSVLKQFFLDVANQRVAALSPRQRTRREAPSVFPLSVGGCASTRSLDVAAFIYKFTCKNFDQAQQWGKETTRLSSYRTEKKLQPIFLLEQLRWLPLNRSLCTKKERNAHV